MIHLFWSGMRNILPQRKRWWGVSLFIALLLGGSYLIYQHRQEISSLDPKATDTHIAFTMEIYDTIFASYWNAIEEVTLVNFYERVSEALLKHSVVIQQKDRAGLIVMLENELEKINDDGQRKEFIVTLSAQILEGLEPAGRSGLFTQQQTQELANRVQNINPDSDLYETIGISKDASTDQIAAASSLLEEKLREEAQTDAVAREKLQEVIYAKEVLTNINTRSRYDSTGAEPTIFIRRLSDDIVHVYIERFSPSTFDEFVYAMNNVDQTATPSSLILDLRDNIGGSVDILPYLLGPLIGPGNYAFTLFSKEIQSPISTQAGWLESLTSYKKIAILINENTQSSGEVLASTLKKYNVGVLVGKKTRGWGTIERIFPIENQIDEDQTYGMFLVHSITLGDDNQPIEGRGITPLVDIEEHTWKQQLRKYWNDQKLIESIEDVWETLPPGTQ